MKASITPLSVAVAISLAAFLQPPVRAQIPNTTVLYSFGATPTDAISPNGSLIQAKDGELYGTSAYGGADGDGTIFKISTSGAEKVLYSFTGANGDGSSPEAGLILASDGNLYGTTSLGGLYDDGTVFRATTEGNESTLYSFGAQIGDASQPSDALIEASDGNLYGTTEFGGAGWGTVYRITLAGAESVIHVFAVSPDDTAYPRGSLIEASDGNLYGTAQTGGAYGGGAVYGLSLSGNKWDVYSFMSGLSGDANNPLSGVIQGNDGDLYGTGGGGSSGYGAVYKVSLAGSESVIHSFDLIGESGDGGDPRTPVLQTRNGDIYGTTFYGGAGGYSPGCVFRIDSAGRYAIIHGFLGGDGGAGNADGAVPSGALMQASNGNVYGTTSEGGSAGDGTLFRIGLSNGPFPGRPVGVTAGPGNAVVTLAWQPVADDTSYVVYRGLSPGGESLIPTFTGITGTTYADTEVTNGTRYYYKVAAVDAHGTSAPSSEVTAKPMLPITVSTVSLDMGSAIGGRSIYGHISLSGTTTSAGLSVSLSSTDSASVSVPATIFVPGGRSTEQFTATTYPVSSDQTVSITATVNASMQSANLTVKAPVLESLAIEPKSVVGGASATGTVTLTGAAAVAMDITLSSNNSKAVVPASVTVAAGADSATFGITSAQVRTTQDAVIKAKAGAMSKSAMLQINAPPAS